MQRLFVLLLWLSVLASCSTKENTARSRFWQSFTARYNTYYNGRVAFDEGCAQQMEGNYDHFSFRIPVFVVGNEATCGIGKGQFDKAITKSKKDIQLHSIRKKPKRSVTRRLSEKERLFLQRQEFNPFLKNAWLMMGQAQYHQGHFIEAAATFSYVIRLYAAEPKVAATARVWMARCYAQLDWLYDAAQAIDALGKVGVRSEKHLRPIYAATRADLLLRQGRSGEAVPYLQEAVRQADTRLEKARLYYLLGQVEQGLGHKAAAYKALRQCLRKSPPYRMALSARILQTEVMGGAKERAKVIKQLRRMARSDKNKDYLDQVYYALGNVYLAAGDTATALSAYEKGRNKSESARVEKAVLLLRMASIYWEKGRYDRAQTCYNEALGMIDKKYPDFDLVTQRSEVLDQLVPFTKIVMEQDSLQALVAMPEKERMRVVDEAIEVYKRRKKEEERLKREQTGSQYEDGLLDHDMERGMGAGRVVQKTPTNVGDKRWYFYNPTLVQNGKREFERQWGKRKNEDHWRRKNKTMVNFNGEQAGDEDVHTDSLRAVADSLAAIGQTEIDEAQADEDNPLKRAFYLRDLPFTAEQKSVSDSLIADALFHAGVIEKDELEDFSLAERTLTRLIKEYKEFPQMSAAYYELFLLYSRWGKAKQAEDCKRWLAANYPDDVKTQRIHSPLFMQRGLVGEQIEDSLYTETYAAYRAHEREKVEANFVRSTNEFPDGVNRAKFIFLHALSRLDKVSQKEIEDELVGLVKSYPKSDVAAPAAMIVNGLRAGRKVGQGYYDVGSLWNRRMQAVDSATQKRLSVDSLSNSRNVPFVFMVAYPKGRIDDNALLYAIAHFQFSGFYLRSFGIEKKEEMMLSPTQEGVEWSEEQKRQNTLTEYRIYGFENYAEVHQYAQEAYADSSLSKWLKAAEVLLISEENLKLVPQVYSFSQYRAYFLEHFAPIKIEDGVILDRSVADSLTKYEDRPAVIYPLIWEELGVDSMRTQSHEVIVPKSSNPLLPKQAANKQKVVKQGYPMGNEKPKTSKEKEKRGEDKKQNKEPEKVAEEDDTGGWYPI